MHLVIFSSFYWLISRIFPSNFLYAVAFPISCIIIAYRRNLLRDMLYLWDAMTGNEFWISSEGVILTFMISFVFSRKLKVSVTPRKSSAPVTSARRCCSILPLLWFKKYLTFPLQRCHIQQLLHIQPTKYKYLCCLQVLWFYSVLFCLGYICMEIHRSFNTYVRSL